MKPVTRIEKWLAELAKDEDAIGVDNAITRIELWLDAILNNRELNLVPITRMEHFLNAILKSETPQEPITRIEIYLSKIAGADIVLPEPITRIEKWLYDWAESGKAELVTVSGVAPLLLGNALARPIHSLTQYGKCTQDDTPTPDAPVDIVCNNGAIKVSPNLANMVSDNIVVGKYINNSGVETADTANFFYAPYIPVTPGGTYTMAMSSSIWYFSVMQYDSSKNFLRRTIWGATNTPVGTEKTFSVGADCAFIRFGSNMRKGTISLADVLAVDWMLTQTATAQDFRPYGEIYTGGTHPGQNLVDLTSVTDDYYYDPNGVYTAVSNARLTDYIPVRAGQKYTVYVKAQQGGTANNVRCNLFNAAKTWKSQSVFVVNSGSEAVSTITPAENGYLRVSANYTGTGAKVDWSTLQIVAGEYTLSTMPPYKPYEEIPYLPEVLTVSGVNLFNKNDYTEINAYVNANTGVLTAGSPLSNTQYCAVIPCKPNALYNITGQGTSAWGAFPSDSIGTTATAFTKGGNLITGANDRYLIGLVRANGDTIDYRNTLVVQEPQTASVPMLLGVGDYKDAAELINGIKTGKVGIYVFTGKEAFTKGTAFYTTNTSFLPSKAGSITPICTHFQGISSSATRVSDSLTMTVNGPSGQFRGCVYFYADRSLYETAEDFQAWLASEYANGTPVIVLYPRSTETTEQGTAQHLVTHEGINIVDAASNVDPVELKAEYYAND